MRGPASGGTMVGVYRRRMRTVHYSIAISAYPDCRWNVAIIQKPYTDGRQKTGKIIANRVVDDRGLWSTIRGATVWIMERERARVAPSPTFGDDGSEEIELPLS